MTSPVHTIRELLATPDAKTFKLTLPGYASVYILAENEHIARKTIHAASAALHSGESLVPIKEALAKAKLALDSCHVNDTQFPLDTQYYDRELVDKAISIIDKLPK